MREILSAAVRWIVVTQANGNLYAFAAEEIWDALLKNGDLAGVIHLPLQEALALREADVSTGIGDRNALPAIDRSWRPTTDTPSVDRYVQADSAGFPVAIGLAPIPELTLGLDAAAFDEAPVPEDHEAGGMSALPNLPNETTEIGATPQEPEGEDEGTSPVRYPSIGVTGALIRTRDPVFIVDLLRAKDAVTQGEPLQISLPANWDSREITVFLHCQDIEFDAPGKLTIKRNHASIPVLIVGHWHAASAALTAGKIGVTATFFDGTRFCGAGFSELTLAGAPLNPEVVRVGSVVAPTADRPDVTVYISAFDGSRNHLSWLIVTERFDGLPAQLQGQIDLGRDPASESAALFAEFATLPAGGHRQSIEAFGTRLWQKAPSVFRDAYWALWDRYQRPLTIQFVCGEPHLPWELMRPTREDERETHAPLALMHATARWIQRWDGYMPHVVPPGRVCTIAPKYPTLSAKLPHAQRESESMVKDFAAVRVDGTWATVNALLETSRPEYPISVLHFAGHGNFSAGVVTRSSIQLTDRNMYASEVERPEVRLGKACRTLVFFNACEVGASGNILGEIGGWADAFLGRQFGGFIAPLWSVDDEYAGIVACELLSNIITERKPVAEALREIRNRHQEESPTFYSYLYYGDVMARLEA